MLMGCTFAQELLTALLMRPVTNLPSGSMPETCDITVGDILGPVITSEEEGSRNAVDRPRNANFSLLSYSFSLVSPGTASLCHSNVGCSPEACAACAAQQRSKTWAIVLWLYPLLDMNHTTFG